MKLKRRIALKYLARFIEVVADKEFLAMVEHLRGTGEIFINNQYFTDVCYELEALGETRRVVGQISTLGYHPVLLLHLFNTPNKTILCLSDGRRVDFLIPDYHPASDCSAIDGTWFYY